MGEGSQKMTEKPIIIATHGLANKPEEDVLHDWWLKAIKEGLRKNQNKQNPDFDFSLCYWAHHLYKQPLHLDGAFKFDQLYNDEPYVEAEDDTLKTKNDNFLDKIAAGAFDIGGETLDVLKQKLGINSAIDFMLGKLLKDLNLYYQNDEKRATLRNELRTKLLAAQGRKIMLVAHSMGSIIAYDVLTLLGQSHSDFSIDSFVTIGSPLGLPHVRNKIVEEFVHRGEVTDRVRTPSVVTNQWVNFADRKDPVALDIHLGDDYKANKDHIKCKDDLVYNDYRIKKGKSDNRRNHHKSYGYLRTPEFSKLTKEFLS